MKIRTGFVSNSSSSSFIVIGNDFYIPKITGVLEIGKYGEREFGWQNEKYDGFFDRLNFAVLQAMYFEDCGKEHYMELIHKVLYDNLDIEYVTNLFSSGEKIWGYIDHQSAACEGENLEMFESEQSLINFLFCSDSFIQCGNDNN